MKLHRYSRLMAAMAAALVLGLTVFTIQSALAVTTVPNATRQTFAVAGGAFSPSWSIPTGNAPVHMMVSQITVGSRSLASGTFTANSAGGFPLMSWNGLNSYQTSGGGGGGNSSLSSGFTNAANVVLLDHGWGTSSVLVTALDGSGNATRFAIRNDSGSTMTSVVVTMW